MGEGVANGGRAEEDVLDTRGLRCPEPVMLLHARLRKMPAGGLIRVLASDPSTTRDIPRLCEHLGHALLAEARDGDDYVYRVQKKTD